MAQCVTAFSAFVILMLGCAVFPPAAASAAPASVHSVEKHAPAGGAETAGSTHRLHTLRKQHRLISSSEHSKSGPAASRAHSRRLKVRKESGHRSVASSKLKLRRANTANQNPSCSVDLKTVFTGITFDYVCDVTDFLLHNDGHGTTNWESARPASGCHQYVAYWNQEHAKPSCSVGGMCSACSDSPDLAKMTAYLQGGTCEPCGPDASVAVLTPVATQATTAAPVVSASPFDLADTNGDGVLSRDEYSAAIQTQQPSAAEAIPSAADGVPSGEELESMWDMYSPNGDEAATGTFTFADAQAAAQAAIAEEAKALKAATADETPAEERAAALLAKAMAAELKASTLGEKKKEGLADQDAELLQHLGRGGTTVTRIEE